MRDKEKDKGVRMVCSVSGTEGVLYSAGDVAVLLNIKESTLRKYCNMLEEAGYKFHKNELGHRGFFDKDVISLKKVMQLKNSPDMTLKQACNVVVTMFEQVSVSKGDTTNEVLNERDKDRYISKSEFMEFQEDMRSFNQKLIEQLEKQNKWQEQRDQQLMQVLDGLLEQKQLAAAQEKKKWWKFW